MVHHHPGELAGLALLVAEEVMMPRRIMTCRDQVEMLAPWQDGGVLMRIQTQRETYALRMAATVSVMGRPFTYGEMNGGKFYHGSPHDLPDGTMLQPGHPANFSQSSDAAVSITSDPKRAAHWAQQSGGGHVYEVEPQGDIDPHRVGLANSGKNWELWEGRVPGAKIIRKL